MQTFRLFFWTTLLLTSAVSLPAQAPDWRAIVPAAFLLVIDEMNDSISARRVESAELRSEMEQLMGVLNFDRNMIFGKEDIYFKEGLHKHFTRDPGPLQQLIDRDTRVVRLENLHTALYFSDKALFRWLGLLEELRKSPDMGRYGRWAEAYNNLPVKERPREKNLKKWVADQLVCDLATSIRNAGKAENPNGKVRNFDPKFEFEHAAEAEPIGTNGQLPLRHAGILASFPINGQFAFEPSEAIAGVGYVVFTNHAQEIILNTVPYSGQFKARWTSSQGDVIYTAAELRNFKKACFFNLPKTLTPGEIYQLELLCIPAGLDVTRTAPPNCWEIMRGKPAPLSQRGEARLEGEVSIVEIYFRAGKYDMQQKAQTMKGSIDWVRGALLFETDEPLDALETQRNGKLPAPVSFSLQNFSFYKINNALNSKALYYYLTVPKVELLDNLPPGALAAAERDHTLDAPFVRNTSLGNSEGYPSVAEDRPKDVVLPGNYLAPAYKPYSVKDSLVTETPVPVITRAHFDERKPLYFAPTRCTLYVGELQQLLRVTSLQQAQVKRRVEERAQFFYMLEKRRAQRSNKPFNLTLEQFRQQELQQLPEEVKTLLNANLPQVFQEQLIVYYVRQFPGTKQYTVNLEIKFEQPK